MALRQFVTEDQIKAETTISTNVESSLLIPFVEESQERHLREALGDDLFDSVLDQVESETLTSENEALVAKIASAAAWWVLFDALPFLRGRITNKGAVWKSSEDSQQMDSRSFEALRTESGNRATEKTNRFLKWLEANKEDYPLWIGCKAKGKNYFSGIEFG